MPTSLTTDRLDAFAQSPIPPPPNHHCPPPQVDEPALREGLPLKKAKWDGYLRWAVDAFRSGWEEWWWSRSFGFGRGRMTTGLLCLRVASVDTCVWVCCRACACCVTCMHPLNPLGHGLGTPPSSCVSCVGCVVVAAGQQSPGPVGHSIRPATQPGGRLMPPWPSYTTTTITAFQQRSFPPCIPKAPWHAHSLLPRPPSVTVERLGHVA